MPAINNPSALYEINKKKKMMMLKSEEEQQQQQLKLFDF
jgi:hypothetical protein